jgi:hypothetical protein
MVANAESQLPNNAEIVNTGAFHRCPIKLDRVEYRNRNYESALGG